VQHALYLDGRNGGAFNRTQQDATKSVTDGGTETAFKGLRPEAAVLIVEGLGVGGKTLGLLKAFPKHSFSPRPCCSVATRPPVESGVTVARG